MTESMQTPESNRGRVGEGAGWTLLILIVSVPLNFFLIQESNSFSDPYAALYAPMFFAFGMLPYSLLVGAALRSKGRSEALKGLVSGTGLLLLVNSACTGYMFLVGRW